MKPEAMLQYRRVTKAGILFRFFEIFLILIFLSWFFTRLPGAVKIFGDFFKCYSVFIVSPRFIFLIGNAIVLTLFVKSGQLNPNGKTAGTDLYDEYFKISLSDEEDEQIDKGISVNQTAPVTGSVTTAMMDAQIFRRSRSANVNDSVYEKSEAKLRRTETDICRKTDEVPSNKNMSLGEDQEMSNEEFQRKIEAFIAKQMKFHKEESMAIVLQNQSREPVLRSREIKV